MGNTDKTLPTLVTDKDDIFPEIQQKEGKFLWIKYKKGLNEDIIDEIDNELLDCANICNQLDKRIEEIKTKAEK